jgi:hypothetical protein
MSDKGSAKNGGGTMHKSAGGMTIKVPFGKDSSSHKVEGGRGQSMGGSKGNLAHSLKGTSST